jgi:hypothetical protein
VRGAGEDGFLGRSVRSWQAGERCGTHFEKCQVRFERVTPRQWSADQPDHLFYSLRRTLPVARWPPQTDQKSDVPGDAVADVAKPGEVDEQPLLEQRRQRVVEVAELGEPPQVPRDIGRLAREAKEVGQHTEAVPDIALERLDS